MTRVAILWHMHQPFYQDLVTGEHVLPWVRLHALKDYFGMVALLREFPGVRVTFNLVPSLFIQLAAFAENRAQDRALELSLKPADALTTGDVEYIRANFFHAQRQRMIDVYPRYAELLTRRAGPLSTEDLRDLQVWHKLAWVDPSYLENDARVRGLVARGAHFTEDDKALLRVVELEVLNRVVPEYRDAAARGQVELSASPFYHPILPLLCDTDVYQRTHADAPPPRHPFARPEDAAEQLLRAATYHAGLFGDPPKGLWPSEGSVSDAMIPLAAAAGFGWMATDELILARSLGITLSRDAGGHIEQPERLYAPYLVRAGAASIACAFRDHSLSDRIGFVYSGWAADAAAADFTGRLAEAGRRFSERSGGEEALIPIILDGENAWEYYEGGGRPFLRALYAALSDHPDLRTVTMSEGCGTATRELTGIFPGSWIDGNFYIWIGHADDRKAWSQVADARDALDEAETAGTGPDLAAAREEILIAEGSDWCWWYGDDHSSAHDEAFDELFRRHLRNAYRLMGRQAPDELFVSNISSRPVTSAQVDPTALVRPTIDGEETSFFEWLGAGLVQAGSTVGTMHQIERREPVIAGIRFGFDATRLYVRADGRRPMADVLADGCELSVKFLTPAGRRISVLQRGGRLAAAHWERDAGGGWTDLGSRNAVACAGRVLEVAIPFDDLGVAAGEPLSFVVAVFDGANHELERHPPLRPIEITLPTERFAAEFWRP
jgi:alpha-amylase/alpha-mannosidase (GH57 family)